MKRFKKPKENKKSYTHKELRELCEGFVSKSCIIMAAAMADELDLTEDQVCAVAERATRYAKYESEHLIKMSEISDAIEKKTGIIWRW